VKAAAGALFLDGGRILLVKTAYLDYWLPPGGGVEPGESPRDACAREVLEEIGLETTPRRLLCVDFVPRGTEIGLEGQTQVTTQDELVFMFYGGTLRQTEIDSLRPDGKEVTDLRWMSLDEAMPLLPNYLKTRLPRCLDALLADATLYLEAGRPTRW